MIDNTPRRAQEGTDRVGTLPGMPDDDRGSAAVADYEVQEQRYQAALQERARVFAATVAAWPKYAARATVHNSDTDDIIAADADSVVPPRNYAMLELGELHDPDRTRHYHLMCQAAREIEKQKKLGSPEMETTENKKKNSPVVKTEPAPGPILAPYKPMPGPILVPDKPVFSTSTGGLFTLPASLFASVPSTADGLSDIFDSEDGSDIGTPWGSGNNFGHHKNPPEATSSGAGPSTGGVFGAGAPLGPISIPPGYIPGVLGDGSGLAIGSKDPSKPAPVPGFGSAPVSSFGPAPVPNFGPVPGPVSSPVTGTGAQKNPLPGTFGGAFLQGNDDDLDFDLYA
ncbi:hypothetical protein GGR53DRAFT_273766 [Hypoxylon sp. FL1150]|nr:hypothetical protein GGR53DRAFT_273766 [Hypoxylon sp. FL1150]